jgi:hypothetical protein
MSQLFGAYGSQLRGDYVQPPVKAGETQFVAKGAFLRPGDGVASLDPADPSRYRPGTYVLPTQIELLPGYFDRGLQFYDNNPNDTALIMPRDTFVVQAPEKVPVGYTYEQLISMDPRVGAQAQLAAQRGSSGRQPTTTNPYGLTYGGAINPANCPGYITVGGSCQLPPNAQGFVENSAIGNTWQ